MSSTAALNRPERCLQELNDFDCSMGWTFHDLGAHSDEHADDEFDLMHREHKRREHTHTAFDERVEAPTEFVAPIQAKGKSSSHQKSSHHKQKSSAVHSGSSQRREAASSNLESGKASKPSAAVQRHRLPRSRRGEHEENEESVDFVYDVDVRRRLREKMDAERTETRQKATLREERIRSESKWVRNGSKHQLPSFPTRRQAWQSTESEASMPGSPTTRATSADSSRSCRTNNSRPSAQKTLVGKTSLAPNVSEWRPQTSAFHPSAESERVARELQRRKQQLEQQCEAHEVARSLDAFEHKM